MDDSSIDAVQALADPVRHRLYEYVVAADGEVGRGQAADALGIQRTLAAHHLDRLAETGLLEVSRRKMSGREGPGSGRPAKLYRRSARELSLHLPSRDYELAAHVLAEAVERHGTEEALHAAAREEGRRIGEGHREEALPDLLRSRGYEPEGEPEFGAATGSGAEGGARTSPADRGDVWLRNCPLHTLARAFPPLACGLNLELLRDRREWFEHLKEAYLALRWIPSGTIPTAEEAGRRLELLREQGPTPEAFTLRTSFPPPTVRSSHAW